MAVHLAGHALKSLTAECFEYLLIIDLIKGRVSSYRYSSQPKLSMLVYHLPSM